MSQLDKTLLFEQLETYQIQRHDFLNNFQVIRGYLQLNMPDRALAYIDEAIAGLLPQQEIYKVGQKSLLAILMGLYIGVRLKGVEMMVSFPPEMKKEEFWLERWQEEYALQFYGYTKECISLIPEDRNPEDLFAEIHLTALTDGFACEFLLLDQRQPYLERKFSTK
ncbi:MAG: histidine kinase [Peptococcaceae bacterium]|nr:histidine kinase [Peptococcaceae bacterium]